MAVSQTSRATLGKHPNDPDPASGLPAEDGQSYMGPRRTRQIRLTPQIPRQPKSSGLTGFLSKGWNYTPEGCVKKAKSEQVEYFFNHGGDETSVNTKGNNLIHNLCILHGGKGSRPSPDTVINKDEDTAEEAAIRSTTRALVARLSTKELNELCSKMNTARRTPWHELLQHCGRPSEQLPLTSAGRIIIEELMKGGANPLIGTSINESDDFPAVALLPKIQNDPQLLKMLIMVSPQLELQHTDSISPEVWVEYPNLWYAAIHKRLPDALHNLLYFGGEYDEERSPAVALTQYLDKWPTEPALQECAQILFDQNVFLREGIIEFNLITLLNDWESQLGFIGGDRRKALKKAVMMLLQLICTPNMPLTLRSVKEMAQVLEYDEPRDMLQDGLEQLLREKFPNLCALIQERSF